MGWYQKTEKLRVQLSTVKKYMKLVKSKEMGQPYEARQHNIQKNYFRKQKRMQITL